MNIIYVQNKSPIQRINSIGKQVRMRKQLEGKGVQVITKEQAQEAWGKVKEQYGGTEYISNCCGAEILEPVQDGVARCPECYEGCKAIKTS